MEENFVIHIKIDDGCKKKAKATMRIPEKTLKELCQIVNQKLQYVDFDEDEESNPTPEGEYLTINELCKHLKIGRMTIWRHSKKGILKPRKIGNRVLFARADIDEYMKKGGEHGEQ